MRHSLALLGLVGSLASLPALAGTETSQYEDKLVGYANGQPLYVKVSIKPGSQTGGATPSSGNAKPNSGQAVGSTGGRKSGGGQPGGGGSGNPDQPLGKSSGVTGGRPTWSAAYGPGHQGGSDPGKNANSGAGKNDHLGLGPKVHQGQKEVDMKLPNKEEGDRPSSHVGDNKGEFRGNASGVNDPGAAPSGKAESKGEALKGHGFHVGGVFVRSVPRGERGHLQSDGGGQGDASDGRSGHQNGYSGRNNRGQARGEKPVSSGHSTQTYGWGVQPSYGQWSGENCQAGFSYLDGYSYGYRPSQSSRCRSGPSSVIHGGRGSYLKYGGYGWEANAGTGWQSCAPTHSVFGAGFVHPFPAAAAAGYSSIPRYGHVTGVPRYAP